MGQIYSQALRERLILALEEGMSAAGAARRLFIPSWTAQRWAREWRLEAKRSSCGLGGDRRSGALEAQSAKLLGWLEVEPDLYLRELVARLAAEGVGASIASVRRLLLRHGITRKKRRPSPPSANGRTWSRRAPPGART